MGTAWTEIDGGVTAPAGFLAGAVNCGIRSEKPDVALLLSDRDAVLAGTFTSNRLAAAPVAVGPAGFAVKRSEERRVGKECRSR